MKAARLGCWLLVAAWPLLTIRESLWVDELHTSWVVDGGWSDVASRAAVGNQSPLYFWGVKAVGEAVAALEYMAGASIPSELRLRFLSWLAWLMVTFTLLQGCRNSVATMCIVSAWLLVDRIGLFYAIEARPYMLLTVPAIVMLQRSAVSSESISSPVRSHKQIDYVWIACAVLAFYLHYTAAIMVFWSWIGRLIVNSFGFVPRTDFRRHARSRFAEAAIVGVAVSPGLLHFRQIGSYSQQWSGFAGDASLFQLIDLLPWIPFCLVPFACWSMQPNHLDRDKTVFIQASILAGGMIATVWLTTYFDFAPLAHRRYILGALPACLVVGIVLVRSLRSGATLFAVGAVSLLVHGWWQGTFREWSHGRWTAWQRQEDWRAVAAFLNKSSENGQPIFVAPMLIETHGDSLDPRLPHDYLVSPLTTVYAVDWPQRLHPLPNNHQAWLPIIRERMHRTNAKSAWIVARTFSTSMVDDLNSNYEALGYASYRIRSTPTLNAGRLQVMALKAD